MSRNVHVPSCVSVTASVLIDSIKEKKFQVERTEIITIAQGWWHQRAVHKNYEKETNIRIRFKTVSYSIPWIGSSSYGCALLVLQEKKKKGIEKNFCCLLENICRFPYYILSNFLPYLWLIFFLLFSYFWMFLYSLVV